MDNKAKILILVEGEKTDVNLMTHLLQIYGIEKNHQIVSYNTNIYVLYHRMFQDNDPDSVDLLQILKEQEKDTEKQKIFDEHYSDILLIFDLDPQDPLFDESKVTKMINYFVESSDMGRLYLNYPMVESFYHMKGIPDESYNSYTATLAELIAKEYKARVAAENRNHDYRKFAVDKNECDIVIKQNIKKALHITNKEVLSGILDDVLSVQLAKLKTENKLFVLCTCAFYISDYNSKLLD